MSTHVGKRGVAYYYGGWHTNLTQQGYTGNSEAESRLISYDYDEKTWRQNTFIDDTPRAEGGLYYIPASDAGMLVYFGGVQLNASGNYSGVSFIETLRRSLTDLHQVPMDVGHRCREETLSFY